MADEQSRLVGICFVQFQLKFLRRSPVEIVQCCFVCYRVARPDNFVRFWTEDLSHCINRDRSSLHQSIARGFRRIEELRPVRLSEEEHWNKREYHRKQIASCHFHGEFSSYLRLP